MNHITRFSLKNALAVIIIVVMIAAGGFYSASQLNRESMPDITIPIVSVATPYPGASPSDVYKDVTKPIETALRGVRGVNTVTAQSGDSFSMVIAEFGYSDDMDKVEQNVNKALATVKLPERAVTPTVSRMSMSSGDILKISLTGDKQNYAELAQKVDQKVLPALKTIDGVGSASIATDPKTQVRITFDAAKLKKEGLQVSDIISQMQAASLSFPVGAVDLGKTTEPVRVSGTFNSVKDIENFVIAKYPSTGEMMGDAFSGIGSAFAEVGKGMGALGKGIGQVGQATGKVAANTGMINGIQQIQGNLVDLKLQREQTQEKIADLTNQIAAIDAQIKALDPTAPDYATQMGALQAKRGPLAGQLTGMKQALKGINEGIKQMTAAASAIQKSIDKNNASLKQSAGSMQSGGGSSASTSMSMGASSTGMNIETIPLSKVATVSYGADSSVVMSRADGQDAVLISIKKTQDGNTVKVAEAVNKKLASLSKQLGPDVKTEVVYDASIAINDSVSSMVREGLLGALFAVIVILIFLRNWRATTIVAFSIPVSVLTALLSMKVFGITLNAMTLGGLTVAIGRIVDDSIVVVENVFRHIQEGAERTPAMILSATKEVAAAITASTITTVAVFLPLGFVSGIVGKIFMPFALTVTIALLASLIVALALIPVLSKYFLLKARIPEQKEPSALERTYDRLLKWGLAHRARVIIGALLLFVASLALIPAIGTGFMPDTAEKYMSISVEYPEGTKATVVDSTVEKVEKKLETYPEVAHVQTTIGSNADGSGSNNTASLFVKLNKIDDFDGLIARARKDLAPLTNAQQGISVVVKKKETTGMSGGLDITFKGNNTEATKLASTQFMKEIENVPNVSNLKSNLAKPRKQLNVTVNQKKAAKYGLTTAMVMGTVQARLSEQTAGTVDINNQTIDVTYKTNNDTYTTPEAIGNIKMATPTGETIAIKDVSNVKNVNTPIKVLTKDGTQYASVTGDITSEDSGKVIKEVKQKLKEFKLPKGVTASVGGEAEMMSETFTQMGMAMLIAVFAVFLCLILTFGEAAAPFAILFSLPLAAIGGLFGLWIARLPLDMPAMIGALMLIGIVVTNAVVFIERVNQMLKAGESRYDALVEAGGTRVRPILMTALTTIIALVPLASGFGEGALISQSLAVIVLGGMTSSTFLTLLVLPVVYDVFESAKEKRRSKKERRSHEFVVEREVVDSSR